MALKDKKGNRKDKKQGSKVPRLDLSKVKIDSEDDSSDCAEGDQNDDKLLEGTIINN